MDADAVAMDYGTIIAEYNYWEDGGSSIAYNGGNVDISNPVSDYNGGWSKVVPLAPKNPAFQIMAKRTTANSDAPFLDATLIAARQRMAEGNYDDAIELFSKELKSDVGLAQKNYALARAKVCFDQAKRSDFVDFLSTEVRPALSKTDELYVETLELEGISLVNAKQYAKAADVFATIKSTSPDKSRTYEHALFNLTNLYRSQLADNGKAKTNLDELKAKYPKDILTWQAAVLSGEQIPPPDQTIPKKQQTVQLPEQTALLSNYPNPFNPTTMIQYRVDAPGQVRLVVYDVLGREVAVLVDSHEVKGSYAVTFDGSSLTSGIYFTRLNAGGKTLLQKMLLLK